MEKLRKLFERGGDVDGDVDAIIDHLEPADLILDGLLADGGPHSDDRKIMGLLKQAHVQLAALLKTLHSI